MRFLLDNCMDVRAAAALRRHGHDVEHVQEWPSDPGDLDILRYAYESKRVLITLDNDFGKLIVADGLPHAGLLRLADFATSDHADATLAAVHRYAEALERGALVVFEPDKSRVRE